VKTLPENAGVRIFHVATVRDWAAALADGVYRVSTLGATIDEVGFIHASTEEQVGATATRFYADVEGPLVVLVLDADRLRAAGVPVRLEDAGTGELFPHLYAALPVSLVDEVRPAAFDEAGAFTF
jgi:uncharacterized protein (DUF952 family)